MKPRPLLKGAGGGKSISLRREKGESPCAFRRAYARQIGMVVEAKTAQTLRVLQFLSHARRVWGSGPGHQCPL